jgi:hypothetical protein
MAGRKRETLIKALILFALVCEFLQVLLFLAFTPPLESVANIMGVISSTLRANFDVTFFFHQSIFYHSLAAPFIAVLVYVVLLIFDLTGFAARYAMYSVTAGYLLVLVGGLSQIVTRWNPIAQGIFLTGLSVCFTAGVALLFAFNPFAKTAARERQSRRWRLIRLNMWLAVLLVLATAALGAYASLGSAQWGASGVIAKFGLVKSAHEHAMVAIIDAAIVILVAEHFGVVRFGGQRGLFIDLGMYSMLAGIPVVAIATYASIPFGVAAHNVITPSAALLLQGALFVTYAIMADMTLRPGKGGVFSKLFGDPLAFGLLFTFVWVDVVVTLPGIYVAMNLNRFAGLPNEVPFIIEHEHALVTLTSMALLLLVALNFDLSKGFRRLIGVTVTAGYVIGLGAGVPYVFLNPDPYTGFAVRYIQVGIILMLVGSLITIIATSVSLSKTR